MMTPPRLLAIAGAMASLVFSASESQAAGCAARFRFCDNCDTIVSFEVKKNTPCTVGYSVANGAVFGQRVIKRGRGIYGTANPTAGAYQPPANFTGSDTFEVQVDYERSGTRYKTVLKVTATVTD